MGSGSLLLGKFLEFCQESGGPVALAGRSIGNLQPSEKTSGGEIGPRLAVRIHACAKAITRCAPLIAIDECMVRTSGRTTIPRVKKNNCAVLGLGQQQQQHLAKKSKYQLGAMLLAPFRPSIPACHEESRAAHRQTDSYRGALDQQGGIIASTSPAFNKSRSGTADTGFCALKPTSYARGSRLARGVTC
eukprot:507742-Pelagomonas_calceolata.AAC.8